MEIEESSKLDDQNEYGSKKFYDRIRKIFQNAKFDILKSDYYSEEAEIIVKVDNKKIIIKCKYAPSEGKSSLNFDSIIDECSKKAEKENAERAILAISNYKIPRNYLEEEVKKIRAIKDKVVILDDKVIEYYEEVVSALNEWSKYTLLGDMHIISKFGDPIIAPAMTISQGESEFFVFKISPENLLKIAYIFRRDYNPKEAYQRALDIKRLKKDISEFLDSPEAILPTNLIGVFNSDIKFSNNKIIIPSQYKSFWIIDGQHRLYSFCYTKNEIQRDNFELICVGLDGRKWKESKQAKLFVDVNDKSKRISKLLLYDLYELIGIPEMRIELVKKLSRESKIFKEKIKIHKKDKGQISLVTFVNTNSMGRLVNEKNGEFGILFREVYKEYPDYNKEKIRNKCRDFYFKLLENYFKLIQDEFPIQWQDSKNYVLSTDRGIRVLLRLMRLLYKYNLRNFKRIGNQEIFKEAIHAIKDFDFSTQNLKGKYFGEGGADLFLESLKEHIQKKIPDFFPREDKKVLSDLSIEPGSGKETNKKIYEWINLLGKEVFGELPYVDPTTIDYLENLPAGAGIKLFISEIHDEINFKKRCEEFKNKGYNLQIKKITRPTSQPDKKRIPYLHGRWIGGNIYEIEPGSDLMKESVGNKKDRMKLWLKKNSERIAEFKERWNTLSQFKCDVIIENIVR